MIHMRMRWRCELGLLLSVLIAFGAAGCSKQARAKRLIAQANSDFEAERYEQAEIEYLKVLRLAPQTPAAVGHLGLIYYQEGRIPQAYSALEQAVKLDPDNLDLRSKLCVLKFYAGKGKEAEEEARWVLSRQPGQADAVSVLVDSARTTNQVQALRKELEQMRQKSGDQPAYHLAFANFLLREGGTTNAEAEVKQALALDPKSIAAHAVLGSVYLARMDLTNAEAAMRTAAELAPVRSPRRLDYADLKFKTGASAEARKLLEEITQKAPDYVPAWNYLARLDLAERKFDECAACVQKVLAKDPMNYDAASLDAMLKMSKGQGAEAITELERLKTLYPRVKEVQYELAVAYLSTGNTPKAVGCLDQALLIDPNYADAMLVQAKVNLQRGNPDPVVLSMTRLLQRQPQIAEAHFLLADAYLAQSKVSEALAIYQRMEVIFPKSYEVPYALASVLARQSQLQEQQSEPEQARNSRQQARKAAEQALALASNAVPALGLLVDLDLAEHQPQSALERVQKEITRRPAVPDLMVLLAKVYRAQGDFRQAESTLLKVIESAPDSRVAYQGLAQVYLAEKKPQDAVKALTGFITRTNDISTLVELAGIQDQELRDYAAARDSYEKVLTINPKVGPVLNNLAYLYAQRLGQLDKALPLAQRARELSPSDPGAADTLGWILLRKPQPDLPKALALLEEAGAKLPNQPEVQLHVGMVRYVLGQEAGARLALDLAAHSTNSFPGKELAQTRLDILAISAEHPAPADRPKLQQRLSEDPNDLVAGVRMAALYAQAGEPGKAALAYEQLLKQDSRNAAVLRRLSELYAGPLKDPQKAMDYAKDAHVAAPEDPAIGQLLGHLVLQSHDFKWANSLLQDTARKTTPQPELLYDLAWSFYGLGRVPEAQANMQQVLSVGGQFDRLGDARRFLTMTAAYSQAQQRSAASSQLEQALKENPDYVPGLMLSSALFQDKGNWLEAKQALQKVLTLNPLFAPATRDLALLCFQHFPDEPGTYDLAVQARQAFPDDASIAKTLGILSFRRDDFPRARQLLTQATQGLPGDGEALCYLGLTLHRLNQNSESQPVLARALALNPDAKLTQLANQALAEMKKGPSKL